MIKKLGERLGLFPDSSNGAGETKGAGVQFVGAPSWNRLINLDSGTNPDADELTLAIAYTTSAYAFSAIDFRASRVAEAPLMVVREGEDGEEWLADHPLSLLLTEPSPDFDIGELLYLTESYRLTTGGALWLKGLDAAGRVARLTPFSAENYTTEADEALGLIYGRYVVETRAGKRRYLPEEVVHFREANPYSWTAGTNRLEVALSRLDLGHQIDKMVRNFARKAMFPGGVVSPDPSWNPDEAEFQSYVSRIEAWNSGPANAGKPLVLLGGTTFSGTAARMKDLLPDEIMDRIEATVGSVFGVPPVVLGWLVGLRNSPWSQMGEARRMVTEDTIEPRWRDVERRLTRSLLGPDERAGGVKIVFDTTQIRALFDDDKLRADVAALMREEWTRNERRLYTGQEPLEDGDPRGEEIGAGGGDAGGLLGELTGGTMAGPAPEAVKTHDDKGLAWIIFDGTCKAAERTWEGQVFKGLQEWRAGVVRLAEDYLREGKEITPTSGRRLDEEFAEWMETTGLPLMRTLVYPLVFSTADKAVKQAAAKLGLSFSVFEEAILAYAERETAFLVEVMGETTGKAVAGIVQDGLAAGDLIRDLTQRLEDSAQFSRTRAKLVARTETTRAWNGSQRSSLSEYAKTSGKTVTKIWLSAQDDRVRDEHIELDGTQLPIDSLFDNGLTEPGEPNCRCTLIFQISDPLDGPQPAAIGVQR